MKLIKLTLRNFKGIKNFEFYPQGMNADVLADNAVGKTTIYDAFLWLLHDKDSQNKKGFDIKTLNAQGEALHGLEHAVEGVFEIGSKILTLTKVYAEQWTKKRGSAEKTFTGHTTEYFIDSVPVKKNEYEKRISEIIDEDKFRLLTNPAYFNEHLKWQDRRKILLDVCGDLTDEEVIASDQSLSKLPDILRGRKLEDHKKVIAVRRAKINEELKKIPIRVDEVQRSLPDISDIAANNLPADIADIKERIRAKEQELTSVESGGGIAEKQIELRQIEGELIQIKNEVQGKTSELIGAKNRELNQIKTDIAKLESEISNKERTLENNQRILNQVDEDLQKTRDKWYQVDGRQFTFEQNDTCPTCGQHLPENQLTAAREKALADFNRFKAAELETVTLDGKKLSEKKNVLTDGINTLNNDIEKLSEELPSLIDKVANLQVLLEDLIKDSHIYKEDPAYVKKLAEKQAAEDAMSGLQNDNSQAKDEVKMELGKLNSSLQHFQSQLSKIDQVEQGKQRIQELSDQERELAAEYEKLEGELYLTEQFIRSKVALLEEKINSKFKLARFKMFNVQVNGGLEEVCETIYNGVPYGSGLNAGHRIIVGMDIISTLSEYYGFTAPIFVDNAESVTTLPEMDAQVIRLIKPEITAENKRKYSQLVVEVEGQSPNLFKEAI